VRVVVVVVRVVSAGDVKEMMGCRMKRCSMICT
jgi:hypothetical protein